MSTDDPLVQKNNNHASGRCEDPDHRKPLPGSSRAGWFVGDLPHAGDLSKDACFSRHDSQTTEPTRLALVRVEIDPLLSRDPRTGSQRSEEK